MFNLNYIIFTFTCLLVTDSMANNTSADAIGFPEIEENPNLKNKENRQPVYLPSMCPANELYYPGDQKDDWICDCRPAFIYHVPTDKCWPAFRQGPCQEGHYLVLHPNSVLPICEKNPCVVDNYIVWNGKCEMLGATDPCSHLYPMAALAVNATTLYVTCETLNLDIGNRFGDDVMKTEIGSGCYLGCKRYASGKCPASTA